MGPGWGSPLAPWAHTLQGLLPGTAGGQQIHAVPAQPRATQDTAGRRRAIPASPGAAWAPPLMGTGRTPGTWNRVQQAAPPHAEPMWGLSTCRWVSFSLPLQSFFPPDSTSSSFFPPLLCTSLCNLPSYWPTHDATFKKSPGFPKAQEMPA